MAKEVVAVFTYRTKEEIIRSKGSEAWALNPQNAQRCRYLVCTRNRFTYPGDSGPEEHGAAFLVGRSRSCSRRPSGRTASLSASTNMRCSIRNRLSGQVRVTRVVPR